MGMLLVVRNLGLLLSGIALKIAQKSANLSVACEEKWVRFGMGTRLNRRGLRYLDQELRDPQFTRGMTRIWDDVQSNLGPHFLQCPCGRRLAVGSEALQTVSAADFRKGMGHLGDVRGMECHIVLARLLSVYDDCERVFRLYQSRLHG